MKTKFNLFLVFCIVIICSSCSQKALSPDERQFFTITHNTSSSQIDANKAIQFALTQRKQSYLKTKSDNRESITVDSYIPFINTQNSKDTLLHIINFANSRGYAIFATDEQYGGLLAISQEGSFNITDDSSLTFFLAKRLSEYVIVQRNILNHNNLQNKKNNRRSY